MFRRDPRPYFARQKAEKLVHDPMGNVALLLAGGYMYPAWERTPMPDLAGAGVYAYEGLALPVTSLMGGGYECGNSSMPWTSAPYVQQGVTLPYAPGVQFFTPGTSPLYVPNPQTGS